MKIDFVRVDKIHEEMRKIVMPVMDNPKYKYFFCSDYWECTTEYSEFGWGRDAYLIVVPGVPLPGEILGYISWNHRRSCDIVEDVAIILKPENLNRGFGVTALARWLNYMMVDRGIRKIEFACLAENKAAMRLYSQVTELGGREVGRMEKARRYHCPNVSTSVLSAG